VSIFGPQRKYRCRACDAIHYYLPSRGCCECAYLKFKEPDGTAHEAVGPPRILGDPDPEPEVVVVKKKATRKKATRKKATRKKSTKKKTRKKKS
jgi:hypothetical protein